MSERHPDQSPPSHQQTVLLLMEINLVLDRIAEQVLEIDRVTHAR